MADCYCKYCGTRSSSISSLTSGWCRNHPEGANKGRHALYQGGEKSQYFCALCGTKANSISSLTSGWCRNHPQGSNKGHHEPAL